MLAVKQISHTRSMPVSAFPGALSSIRAFNGDLYVESTLETFGLTLYYYYKIKLLYNNAVLCSKMHLNFKKIYQRKSFKLDKYLRDLMYSNI